MQDLADYHFLYFAPGIGARWFFEACQDYWLRYRPIVIYDLAIVRFADESADIVITTIARTDTAELVRNQIETDFPYAQHDALVYDYIDYVGQTLDARTEQNQPFGRPIE